MTDKPPELLPIRLMDKNMPAKMAIVAMRQRQAVTLKNGLKLNYDQKGSVEIDLKMATEFDNQWAAEHPIEAAEFEAQLDAKYRYDED